MTDSFQIFSNRKEHLSEILRVYNVKWCKQSDMFFSVVSGINKEVMSERCVKILFLLS